MTSWVGTFLEEYDEKHGIKPTKSRSIADATIFNEDQYSHFVLEKKDMMEDASTTLENVPAVLSFFQQLQPDSSTMTKMLLFLKEKGFDSHTIGKRYVGKS